MSKAQLLFEPIKIKRKDRAKILLKKLTADMQPLVLWWNEKLFTLQAIQNPQNDRIYGRYKEEIFVESQVHLGVKNQLQLSAGVTSIDLKTSIFIDEGVKVNQHVYLCMLQEKLIPLFQKNMKKTGITLQQDGATSHSAKKVQAWFKENFKRVVVLQFLQSQPDRFQNLAHS